MGLLLQFIYSTPSRQIMVSIMYYLSMLTCGFSYYYQVFCENTLCVTSIIMMQIMSKIVCTHFYFMLFCS
jgi:hypothetical protein